MTVVDANLAVRLQDISKTFRTRRGERIQALSETSLDIPAGGFTSIVGPSGCGKTTLLNIVAGLESATSGTVVLSDEVRRRPPGYAFQRPVLLPWRDVLRNVLLPLEVAGRVTTESTELCRDLLKLAGLGAYINAYPAELSGGMQQRVALVRSLVDQPALLLMDEPFAALDYLTREMLTVELEKLWLLRRPTALFVTHSIPEAVFLSDQVIVMRTHPGTVHDVVPVAAPHPRTWDDVTNGPLSDTVAAIRHMIAQ